MKKMCKDAGIDMKSNHSLHATGATTMFQADIPERVIQKTTGHKSLQSLWCYEQVSMEQHQEVSRVLAAEQEEVGKTSTDVDSRESSTKSFFNGFIDCSINNITINVNHWLLHVLCFAGKYVYLPCHFLYFIHIHLSYQKWYMGGAFHVMASHDTKKQ